MTISSNVKLKENHLILDYKRLAGAFSTTIDKMVLILPSLSEVTEDSGSIVLQVLAALSVTLIYLTSGTFLGWTSPTCPLLMGPDSPIPITSDDCSWIVTIVNFGMISASIPTGILVNMMGRKALLAASAVPFVASWLMITLARSAKELYVARFLAGVGQGIAFTVCPMYLAEISEVRIRGAMGTLFQVMLNVGTLFEFSVGPYVSYKTLALSSAAFPFIFLITFVWMPESPYYLMSKDRKSLAEKNLMKLRGKRKPDSVKEELEQIQLTVSIQKKEKGSVMDLIRVKGNRKALLIVLGLITTQVFSGIIAVLGYVTTIFQQSGSGIDANVSTIVVGVVTLIASVVSSSVVDRAGRKPLLFVSTVGCAVCMLGLGTYYYYAPVIDKSMGIDWIPLALLIIYIIVYMFGLGPLPWAVAGEVFPNNVKGYAVSITAITCAVLNTIIVKLYQILTDYAGVYVSFYIFSVFCAVASVAILFMPETKGKSLLEIYKDFNESSHGPREPSSVSTIT